MLPRPPPETGPPANVMRTSRANLMLERLRVAQLRLAAVALIVMMGVTLLDVTLRYLFNHPVRGSYDLVESMLVIFVFLGISTAFLQRRNIVIDLIDSFAHRAIVAVLIRVSDVLTIATLLLFTYAMVTPALQAFSYGDRKMELGLAALDPLDHCPPRHGLRHLERRRRPVAAAIRSS